MSQFHELVATWNELMHIDPSSTLAEQGLTAIREDRVLELTARYINTLQGMQREHDDTSSRFASEVRALTDGTVEDPVLEEICGRFLGGVGMTLRREIPSSVPRSQRTKHRMLVIDWAGSTPHAVWEGVGESFPLRELLLFCSEHSAGADESLGNVLADQLLAELRAGTAVIPRLAWVSHVAAQSVLRWETALASLNDATAPLPIPAPASPDVEEDAFLISYFEDNKADFEISIHEHLPTFWDRIEDLNIEVMDVITDAKELGDDDPMQLSVDDFVEQATRGSQRNDKLVRAFSVTAFSGIAEAIAAGREEATILQRIMVFKSLGKRRKKIVRKSEKSAPRLKELA